MVQSIQVYPCESKLANIDWYIEYRGHVNAVQSIRVKANLQILIYMCAKAHKKIKKWNHK